MAALVPGVVLENRRKQPLVLAPAMGVHLTHHAREHFVVEKSTKVVSDRHHGGIRLEYKYNAVHATTDGTTERASEPAISFRRGGVRIPSKTHQSEPTQLKIDPYRHGVIISSPSFAADYKLKIPSQSKWSNDHTRGLIGAAGTLVDAPFLLRSASPMFDYGDEDWCSSEERSMDSILRDMSDRGDGEQEDEEEEEYMPRPTKKLMGSATMWESRADDVTCDRTVPTMSRDVKPIFVGRRGIDAPRSQDRITGMAFSLSGSVKSLSSSLTLGESEGSRIPLRLSRCYLTWESLHVIANRDGTVNRRPVMEFHMVYVLDDGKAPSTSLDMSYCQKETTKFIEGDEVRCVVTYMITEDDAAEGLPLLDVLFGTPRFLEQVERQCSTRDTEREISARSYLSSAEQSRSPGIFGSDEDECDLLPTIPVGSKLVKLSSSLSNKPIQLSRSLSGKLVRQLSAEESHEVWRTLRQWDLEYDFKLGTTPYGMYSLMNHEFTFLHYTDMQEKPIDWFLAEVKAPSAQVDALVRPIVNLRHRPYTVNRDERLGIASFYFKK